jgi:hypothetical protein
MSQRENNIEAVVDVDEVTIRSIGTGNEYNLIPHIQEIHIYESIYSSSMSAEILIEDGNDLYTQIPIVGEEEITIEIVTPGTDVSNKYKFFVQDVVNYQPHSSGTKSFYTIRCISKEFLINMCSQYSRKYDDSSENVIKSIISNNLKSDKKLIFEPTKGIFDMMVNNKRPFQVIDLIKARAISTKYLSSYFFYEDRDGYNFTTLENLFNERKKRIGDKEFFFDTANKATIDAINIRTILSMVNENTGNNTEKISGAGMNSITRSFNVLTGGVDVFDFNYERDHQKFEHADDSYTPTNSKAFTSLFGSTPSKQFFMVKDGTKPENFHDALIGTKAGFNQKLSQLKSRIRIYGDNEIYPGDVIKINMPEISGVSEGKRPGSIITDNYLVESMKRTLSNSNRGFQHYMSLTISKGDYSVVL